MDDRPFEVGRLEGSERGEVMLQGWEDGDTAAVGLASRTGQERLLKRGLTLRDSEWQKN